jgi:hypothetical protein
MGVAVMMVFEILPALALGFVVGRFWQVRRDELDRRAAAIIDEIAAAQKELGGTFREPQDQEGPIRLPPMPPPEATLRPLSSHQTGLPRLHGLPLRRAVPTTPAAAQQQDSAPRHILSDEVR